ncbi:hypothetical protein [Legionella bononiensis]|uniref:hypothetical protein n=1 Tax=Legionella bononiensis TaxID=2793102 RepID=UPI0019331C02|nr:hypothetical protein [Legionella bononiensis]MBL7480606.1 hypothetical protein [Legionella bononiensis]
MNTEQQNIGLLQKIEQEASLSNHRISSFIFEGKTYIIKQQREGRSKIGYALLTSLTKLLGMPALQGIHVDGGKKTQDTEVRRLKTLFMADILVPQIIDENERYFVMSCMGDKNFDFILKSTQHRSSIAHWEQILKAIVRVHDKGTYLSQAFSRNMVLHESQEVAFIDFEDDPGMIMPLHLAQTRDWLLCILSTCWRLHIDFKTQAGIILNHLSQDKKEVQEEVLACASKIAFLRFLFCKKKPYKKRELQSFKCLIDVMNELTQLSKR